MGDGIRKGMTGKWYEFVYFPGDGQWGKSEGGEYRTLKGAYKSAYKSLRTHKSKGYVFLREEDYDVNRGDTVIGTSSPIAKIYPAGSSDYLYMITPLRNGQTDRYRLYADGHTEYSGKITYKAQ